MTNSFCCPLWLVTAFSLCMSSSGISRTLRSLRVASYLTVTVTYILARPPGNVHFKNMPPRLLCARVFSQRDSFFLIALLWNSSDSNRFETGKISGPEDAEGAAVAPNARAVNSLGMLALGASSLAI